MVVHAKIKHGGIENKYPTMMAVARMRTSIKRGRMVQSKRCLRNVVKYMYRDWGTKGNSYG